MKKNKTPSIPKVLKSAPKTPFNPVIRERHMLDEAVNMGSYGASIFHPKLNPAPHDGSK
jgi:hypothetical protein